MIGTSSNGVISVGVLKALAIGDNGGISMVLRCGMLGPGAFTPSPCGRVDDGSSLGCDLACASSQPR